MTYTLYADGLIFGEIFTYDIYAYMKNNFNSYKYFVDNITKEIFIELNYFFC